MLNFGKLKGIINIESFSLSSSNLCLHDGYIVLSRENIWWKEFYDHHVDQSATCFTAYEDNSFFYFLILLKSSW